MCSPRGFAPASGPVTAHPSSFSSKRRSRALPDSSCANASFIVDVGNRSTIGSIRWRAEDPTPHLNAGRFRGCRSGADELGLKPGVDLRARNRDSDRLQRPDGVHPKPTRFTPWVRLQVGGHGGVPPPCHRSVARGSREGDLGRLRWPWNESFETFSTQVNLQFSRTQRVRYRVPVIRQADDPKPASHTAAAPAPAGRASPRGRGSPGSRKGPAPRSCP